MFFEFSVDQWSSNIGDTSDTSTSIQVYNKVNSYYFLSHHNRCQRSASVSLSVRRCAPPSQQGFYLFFLSFCYSNLVIARLSFFNHSPPVTARLLQQRIGIGTSIINIQHLIHCSYCFSSSCQQLRNNNIFFKRQRKRHIWVTFSTSCPLHVLPMS